MTTDSERLAAMGLAMESFAHQVELLQEDDWSKPSPCEGWSVFDVVDHVVAGERFVVRIMGGASAAEAADGLLGLDKDQTADDHRRQLDAAAADALSAFTTDLDQLVDHRVGTITARLFLEFRIIDQLGHAWDLAAACGRAVDLDSAALSIGLDIARAERETLERSTNFATTSADLIQSDNALNEFLQLLGRNPS